MDLQYFGSDAGEFYTIGNLIQKEIENTIRDKICILPPLVQEFATSKVNFFIYYIKGILFISKKYVFDILREQRGERGGIKKKEGEGGV